MEAKPKLSARIERKYYFKFFLCILKGFWGRNYLLNMNILMNIKIKLSRVISYEFPVAQWQSIGLLIQGSWVRASFRHQIIFSRIFYSFFLLLTIASSNPGKNWDIEHTRAHPSDLFCHIPNIKLSMP